MADSKDYLWAAKKSLESIATEGERMDIQDVNLLTQSAAAMALVDIAESLRGLIDIQERGK